MAGNQVGIFSTENRKAFPPAQGNSGKLCSGGTSYHMYAFWLYNPNSPFSESLSQGRILLLHPHKRQMSDTHTSHKSKFKMLSICHKLPFIRQVCHYLPQRACDLTVNYWCSMLNHETAAIGPFHHMLKFLFWGNHNLWVESKQQWHIFEKQTLMYRLSLNRLEVISFVLWIFAIDAKICLKPTEVTKSGENALHMFSFKIVLALLRSLCCQRSKK